MFDLICGKKLDLHQNLVNVFFCDTYSYSLALNLHIIWQNVRYFCKMSGSFFFYIYSPKYCLCFSVTYVLFLAVCLKYHLAKCWIFLIKCLFHLFGIYSYAFAVRLILYLAKSSVYTKKVSVFSSGIYYYSFSVCLIYHFAKC